MSQQNVEVMRAAMEAFNRRDGEAFGALLDSNAEIVPVRAVLEGTVYRGPDAAGPYCAAVDESWENLRWAGYCAGDVSGERGGRSPVYRSPSKGAAQRRLAAGAR